MGIWGVGGTARLLPAASTPFSLVWWQAGACDREHLSPCQLCAWREVTS